MHHHRCVALPLRRWVASSSKTRHSLSFTVASRTRSFATNQETCRLEEERIIILSRALTLVHDYGWSSQAIAHAALQVSKVSLIGLVDNTNNNNNVQHLLSYYMNRCNVQLKEDLSNRQASTDEEWTNKSVAERIVTAIRIRLEMNIPYIQSGTWAQGMALGSFHIVSTANHLEETMTIICHYCLDNDNDNNKNGKALLEKAAIGAVYVATELHLLSDSSEGFQDSWMFLRQRIHELEYNMANNNNNNNTVSSFSVFRNANVHRKEETTFSSTTETATVAATAAAAVISSLGGAIYSLLIPTPSVTRIDRTKSTAMSQSTPYNRMRYSDTSRQQSEDTILGTHPNDYDWTHDSPPFLEKDVDTTKSGEKK